VRKGGITPLYSPWVVRNVRMVHIYTFSQRMRVFEKVVLLVQQCFL